MPQAFPGQTTKRSPVPSRIPAISCPSTLGSARSLCPLDQALASRAAHGTVSDPQDRLPGVGSTAACLGERQAAHAFEYQGSHVVWTFLKKYGCEIGRKVVK